MERALQSILLDISRKMDRSGIKAGYIEKSKAKIEGLIKSYDDIQVSEGYRDVYDSLVKRGRELLKESNLRDAKKMDYYLKYCEAALYDFNDNIKPLRNILGLFMLSSILLLVLGPQFLGPAILVFIIPIYLGIRGVKKRSISGLNLALSVMPVTLLTSIIWIRTAILSSSDFTGYVAEHAKIYGISQTTAGTMLISFMVLGVVLLVTSMATIYLSLRHRKMFI